MPQLLCPQHRGPVCARGGLVSASGGARVPGLGVRVLLRGGRGALPLLLAPCLGPAPGPPPAGFLWLPGLPDQQPCPPAHAVPVTHTCASGCVPVRVVCRPGPSWVAGEPPASGQWCGGEEVTPAVCAFRSPPPPEGRAALPAPWPQAGRPPPCSRGFSEEPLGRKGLMVVRGPRGSDAATRPHCPSWPLIGSGSRSPRWCRWASTRPLTS